MAKIMVVDDAMFMRTMLKSILTAAGHDVVAEAGNGLEALEQFPRVMPDLVTMDITMPEMDGIDATRELVRRHPTARILMCSAMGQQQMVFDAIQAGAKGFLVKPFDKEKVILEVERQTAQSVNVQNG